MKKIWISVAIAVVVLGAVGTYFFITRPSKAPTDNVQNVTDTLPAATSTADSPGAEKLYRISQASSSVQFKISEVLNGSPFTPIGVTNQVAGDIAIGMDAADKLLIRVGTIKINARTFKTDNPNRDNAINHLILRTDDAANEYIVFTPTSVNDAPAAFELGKQFNVSVTGDLTISGVTKPVTFAIKAIQTANALTGTAEATIKRSDFRLVIPNVPFVANVSDSFTIGGTFTALPVAQ